MKIQFHGAAREVTGSRHLLIVNGKKILLDCGLYQGKRELERTNNLNFGFKPTEIDYCLLSHAHIDHSGNLPNLVKQGFNGPIYTSHATKDLCEYMLRDCGHIQEKEAEFLNKRLAKKRLPLITPIYGMADAENCLKQFQGIPFHKSVKICDGVEVTYHFAGHILGAALMEFNIDDHETGKHIKFCFTGDLGRQEIPIIPDPYQIKDAEYIIIESTYGDRVRESCYDCDNRFEQTINAICRRGGKIIIPAFALERTQEIVHTLNKLTDERKIPEIPVYVDSPLSFNVTEVFRRHTECFDEETQEIIKSNDHDPFGFERLTYITAVEESKKLNFMRGPYIVIAASGMCEHGRVLHHLKNNIENPANAVFLVGYQAENTLGRKIKDGNKVVNILDQMCRVRSEIYSFDYFSAHADRSDLLSYLDNIKTLKKIFLVHGEHEPMLHLKEACEENRYAEVIMPEKGQEIEI